MIVVDASALLESKSSREAGASQSAFSRSVVMSAGGASSNVRLVPLAWRAHEKGIGSVGPGHSSSRYSMIRIEEPFRGRGLGSYLVQELKRQAYDIGSIPAARCNRDNRHSRKTLLKAGFIPYAHILNGAIAG